MKIALLIALLLLSTAAFAQNTIFVVRHAEKPAPEADALSETGQKRAECLASMLKDAGVKTVITSQFQRTKSTGEPVAKATGAKMEVADARDAAATAARVKEASAAGAVLLVGHSNTIPAAIKALTGIEIKEDESNYDRLFVITLGERPSVVELHYCPVP